MNKVLKNKRRQAQGRVKPSPMQAKYFLALADRPGAWPDMKSIAALLAATLMISASALPPAQADLNSVLAGMYTAAGSPGVYQTQNSGVISGGYVAVRTPIQDVNLISFSPPNIGAGCGGIDLFMGSFSFVNAQAFENLLRQIGQQALGYACAGGSAEAEIIRVAANRAAMDFSSIQPSPSLSAGEKKNLACKGEGFTLPCACRRLFSAILFIFGPLIPA